MLRVANRIIVSADEWAAKSTENAVLRRQVEQLKKEATEVKGFDAGFKKDHFSLYEFYDLASGALRRTYDMIQLPGGKINKQHPAIYNTYLSLLSAMMRTQKALKK